MSPHPSGDTWRYLRHSVGIISVNGGQIYILMSLDMLFRWFRFLWQYFMSYIISPMKNNFIISFLFQNKYMLLFQDTQRD